MLLMTFDENRFESAQMKMISIQHLPRSLHRQRRQKAVFFKSFSL